MAFENRISHIVRIYKDNDPTSDTWVDIERVDNFTVTSVHPDNTGLQSTDYSFDWSIFNPDDPENDMLTIQEPPSDGSDAGGFQLKTSSASPSSSDIGSSYTPPSSVTTIKIPLKSYINLQGGDLLYYVYFDNTENNENRKTHILRIYNREIPKDRLDGNGQPPRNAEDYFNLINGITPDQSQFIDVEVIDKYVLEHNRKHTYSAKNWFQNIDAILSESL
jgi:hypothetical protein